jgi:hypothetical protein
MTTYFEHNAQSSEQFVPREKDTIDWPGIVVTERPMTPEEQRIFKPEAKDVLKWP